MSGDTVTGEVLQFTNDNKYCYAFSGGFPAVSAVQTLFDFVTSSAYIVATLTMSAPIYMDSTGVASGYIRGWQLDFNGKTVGLFKTESGTEDTPAEAEVTILIPPFTNVVLTCVDNGDSGNYLGTASITAKVGMAPRVGNLDE